MQAWRKRLETIGDVTAFDYSYMREGRKRPDILPQLIAAHREALVQARRSTSGRSIRRGTDPGRTILIGKSMGSRIGCYVALEEKVDALVCLGFPLCAMGDQTKMRDEVLRRLATPILFVQGTRDSFCPLELLERVRAAMTAPNFLHTVEGGDHSLVVRKKDLGGKTQDDVDQKILKAVDTFVAQFSVAM